MSKPNRYAFVELSVSVFLIAVLSGCIGSPSKEEKEKEISDNNAVLHPFYYLPTGDLELDVTRALLCPADGNGDIKWKVATNILTVADTSTALPINVEDLKRFGRDTSATISWTEDGRLEGINVTSIDKVGPAIAGIVGGIVKAGLGVATIAAGVPMSPKCSTVAQTDFDNGRKIQGQIDKSLQTRKNIVAKLGSAEPGSSQHQKIKKELDDLDQFIADYRKQLGTIVSAYSFQKKYIVSPSGTGSKIFTKSIAKIPNKIVDAWFAKNGGQNASSRIDSSGEVKLVAPGEWASKPISASGQYVYVRMPSAATVAVSAIPVKGQGTRTIVFKEEVALPQAGKLLAIDLDSKAFKDKTVDLQFHGNGSLKKYGTTENSGVNAITGVTGGIEQATGAYTDYRSARDAQNSDLNELKDENALLEAEITNLTNKQKLEELRTAEQIEAN